MCIAGQLVVLVFIDEETSETSETIIGSAEGDGLGTLDLSDSTLYFAGVPKSVYTSRSVTLFAC